MNKALPKRRERNIPTETLGSPMPPLSRYHQSCSSSPERGVMPAALSSQGRSDSTRTISIERGKGHTLQQRPQSDPSCGRFMIGPAWHAHGLTESVEHTLDVTPGDVHPLPRMTNVWNEGPHSLFSFLHFLDSTDGPSNQYRHLVVTFEA